MSSKIKVDTIENVAGSGNVSLGSGHNLVVPGNITGQGTAAITSNATVGGTLGVTGATTMSGTLTINTASNSLPSISLQHSNSSADNFQLVSGTPGVANSGFSIRDIDAAVNRLVINSAGNIGIGTSAPLRQLHINNTSANSEIAFTAATNGVSSILFGDGLTGTDIYRGYIQYNHANDSLLLATSSTTRFTLNASGNLAVQGVYNDTGSDSPNVVVDGSGNIYRSTSALKYKKDVRDIESIDIDRFRPIRYKSAITKDDDKKDCLGFIADEVHDDGLTELVTYGVNPETEKTEVEGFRYDRMTVILTKVVQEQKTTIETQATQIADLITRVAALEAE